CAANVPVNRSGWRAFNRQVRSGPGSGSLFLNQKALPPKEKHRMKKLLVTLIAAAFAATAFAQAPKSEPAPKADTEKSSKMDKKKSKKSSKKAKSKAKMDDKK